MSAGEYVFHQEDKGSSQGGPVAPLNVEVDGSKVPATMLAAGDFWGTETPPIRAGTASEVFSNNTTSQEVDPQNVVELTKDQAETANEMHNLVANQ